MEGSTFADYYEILQLSPNADSETIDRIFRYFAERYHPDNQDTGDRPRFDAILQAHNTFKDPVKRAQYDIQHKTYSGVRWKVAEEANDGNGIQRDGDIRASSCRFFMSNAAKTPTIPASAVSSLNAC